MGDTDINKYTIGFFSNDWTVTIICVSILIFSVLYIGNKVSKKNKEQYAKILAYIMIGFFITNHIFLFSLGKWEISKELPFHLCSISGLICCFIMFIRKENRQFLFEFLFYCGIIGGIQAILTPLVDDYGGYKYFYLQFFFKHAMIIAFPIYLRNNLGMKLSKFSWFKSYIVLNILMLINIQVNNSLGSNFMYVNSPPAVSNPLVILEHPSYLEFLNSIPMKPYIFWWELIIIILILFVYFIGKPKEIEKTL